MDEYRLGERIPRPKRQRSKDNPYRIFAIHDETGGIKYFVRFIDGANRGHCIEISKKLFMLFDRFELEDISYFNRRNKYYEQSRLIDDQVSLVYARKTKSVEDEVFRRIDQESLYQAILTLPMIQRRRVILYFFHGLTYQQIAEQEGCLNPAVWKSVRYGIKNIKKHLN